MHLSHTSGGEAIWNSMALSGSCKITGFLVQRNLPRPCYSQPIHPSALQDYTCLSSAGCIQVSGALICMVQFSIASLICSKSVGGVVKTTEHSIYAHFGQIIVQSKAPTQTNTTLKTRARRAPNVRCIHTGLGMR